jgi:tetratricopeptide (TPR) repeat protein
MICKPLVIFFVLLIFPSSLVYADVQVDINSLLQKGLELNNASKYNEAIPYFDQVLEIEPNNTKALILKGAMLGQLNQSQKAISYFDKVLEIDPKNVAALSNKGSALLQNHQYNESVFYFDKVLEIDPKNVAALSNKAAALVKLGKIKESIRYSEAALAIDPNHNQAMKNEILAYFKSTLISVKDSPLTVYVEIEIRNSKKQLLVYAEFDDIKYSDLDLTDDYLNSLPVKEVIEKDGKQFDVLVVSDQFPQNEYAVISTDSITSKLSATHYNPLDLGIFTIFYTNHDGIPVDKGDVYTSVWTIIRPHH